eukprot:3018229-Alexandrium_andersonii.AAC.1
MSVLELSANVPGVPHTPCSVLYPEGVLGAGVLPPMWKKTGPSPALRAGDAVGLGGWTISLGRGCGMWVGDGAA